MTTYGTIDQYLGRTSDMVVFHGVQPTGDRQLTMALAEDRTSGAVVTGPQKVVQRFVLELLREKGTRLFDPAGTDFMTEARQGYWRTPVDVMGAFARAVIDIREILNNEESTADPDDERFSDAILQSVQIQGDTVSLVIKIVTLAGDSRSFVFPLPLMV